MVEKTTHVAMHFKAAPCQNGRNHIKGCLSWPGSDVQFDPNISHIKGLPTDRCQSVVQFLILTMDIDKKAAELRKKLEKICWNLNNNPDLSATKRKSLEDQKAALIKEIADLETQLTPLQVTKAVTTTLRH